MQALKNVWAEVRAQFGARGALLARLAAVLAYYALYACSRAAGRSQDDARVRALFALNHRLGLARRVVEVRLRDGSRLALDLMSAAFFIKEFQEDRMYEAFPEFVPGIGQTVIDVGGHQGLFTVPAARRVGPSGRVLAVEPAPANRALLERNVAANGLKNVAVAAEAASDAPGSAALHDSKLSTSYSLVFREEESSSQSVPTRTLDEIASSLGVSRADLIKIDVEGAALKVLAGSSALLALRPRLVMEVEGTDADRGAVARFLDARGFAVRESRGILYAEARRT
ncbi:MAG TPA: FkbM family methyltransferase [Elusimicrobiota bacterium]|nr:FkbM family methyltransferase [Elusimicrobiota bacterium]